MKTLAETREPVTWTLESTMLEATFAGATRCAAATPRTTTRAMPARFTAAVATTRWLTTSAAATGRFAASASATAGRLTATAAATSALAATATRAPRHVALAAAVKLLARILATVGKAAGAATTGRFTASATTTGRFAAIATTTATRLLATAVAAAASAIARAAATIVFAAAIEPKEPQNATAASLRWCGRNRNRGYNRDGREEASHLSYSLARRARATGVRCNRPETSVPPDAAYAVCSAMKRAVRCSFHRRPDSPPVRKTATIAQVRWLKHPLAVVLKVCRIRCRNQTLARAG